MESIGPRIVKCVVDIGNQGQQSHMMVSLDQSHF
jgi:hypothetical protein